jgi:glycosyltransferase involved in cell wall biosynthesis
MKILWLTWKDYMHPQAGGAEVVLRELCHRLQKDGHEVTLLTAAYNNLSGPDTLDGLGVIRIGKNRYFHSFQALAHYIRRLRGRFDVVIDVVNTAPYFSTLFGSSAKTFLFYHQLAREIWFHEAPFPVDRLGFHVLEPMATRMLARKRTPVITVSESTRQDLIRYGFKPDNIKIISEGTELQPIPDLTSVKKFTRPTLLSLGALRAMKRTLEQVKAFELSKKQVPSLRLIIAGDDTGPYGQQVRDYCAKSKFVRDIRIMGRVSQAEKLKLMQMCHIITVTSLKEGWGLIVTEAASQGTPAVVYDVDGLRDSVRHTQTGLVTNPNPHALARGIMEAFADHQAYESMRHAAWEWSRTITFDQCYKDFTKVIYA